MIQYLNIAQIFLSILLIAVILLQQRGGGLGSAIGGSAEQFYSTRRGIEKFLFAATIVIAVLFLTAAIIRIII